MCVYDAASGRARVPGSQFISGDHPELRIGIPIIVTRPKPDAWATRLAVGDRVAVGLMAFRVLPNFALGTERAGRVLYAPQALSVRAIDRLSRACVAGQCASVAEHSSLVTRHGFV